MLPKKKHSIDDDYEARNRTVQPPEMCVDYLSYRFDEMDLAASWRVMTKQKKDVVNGLRLENASWRTWAKHKYRLSTVSPETLNWLKDSDVTWLYGPLHTVIKNIEEKDRYAKPKIASTEDTLGLMTTNHRPTTNTTNNNNVTNTATTTSTSTNINNSNNTPSSSSSSLTPPLKSVLKKVTASDLLRRSASELQASQITADHQHQYQDSQKQQHTKKPSLSLREANKKLKAFSPSVVATHRQPKLRFNQYVEQCVALPVNDPPPSQQQRRGKTRFSNILSDEEEEDDIDDDDDDELTQGYSDDENAIVIDYDHPRLPRSSIKKIEPARLKTNSQSEQETDEVSSLSSSASSSLTSNGGSGYAWMIGGGPGGGQDQFNDRQEQVESSSSDEDNEGLGQEQQLEIRRRAHYIPSSSGSSVASTSSDAIQWVGQPCVYNVQEPSDYDDDDYGFDDDDWTHDENEMPSPPLPPAAPTPASPPTASTITTATTTTTTSTPSVAPPLPCHPRGAQQFFGKAVAVSEPCTIDADEPSISRVSNYHHKVSDIHTSSTGMDATNNSSNLIHGHYREEEDESPTLLGHFAQWASSYLWPKQPSSSSSSSQL
ncbi:hypothetical protein BDA99DRAFT_493895 [Phascolomyces articulosus]|uniref:Nitrogen regulatory protein areA GATA-like domain-containing protein n=1 Tax=Phascolomyces articulosus TaxID=60185 RepID=A0AAD5PL03_9FUNG|nr:hypothetical protein BDA99DRAFT_493895 [Phascolomyces articulosus]